MTDSEIYQLNSRYQHVSFNSCVGGPILYGEQNLVALSHDGTHVGRFYQLGGWHKIVDAYWDKMDGYIDIIHIVTSSGMECYVSGGSSGQL